MQHVAMLAITLVHVAVQTDANLKTVEHAAAAELKEIAV